MNNPADIYLERSRRVASLMAWLEGELDAHEKKAMQPANADKLWPMIGDLCQVEKQLIEPLRFLAGMTDAEIIKALNQGGQDNE